MSEANAQEDLKAIFQEIDKDADGFISRQDLQNSEFAAAIFDNSEDAFYAFVSLGDRMELKDFVLLASAYRLKLHDYAIAKFELRKLLSKHLSAPPAGEAAPSLKQSFIKLTVNHPQQEKLSQLALELGIDKPQQDELTNEIAEVLGHPVHKVFALVKVKTVSNGVEIAQKLQGLIEGVLELVGELAPEAELYVQMMRIKVRYGKGFIYVVGEIDDPFVEGLVNFLSQMVEMISPQCQFKFRLRIAANLHHMLSETFTLQHSQAQLLKQLDIDSFTLSKLKQILGDFTTLNLDLATPSHQLCALLFQEVRMEVELDNLGEALQYVLGMPVASSAQASAVKQLAIKDTLQQLYPGAAELLEMIGANCEGIGEVSLNCHHFFLRVSMQLHIQGAFDLL